MDYRVSVDYSPVYEVFVSLGVYLFPLKTSPQGTEMRKQVLQRIDNDTKNRLNALKESVEQRALFLLVWQCPNKFDVQDCISWLSKLTAGDLYELLNPHLQNLGKLFPSLIDWRNSLVEALRIWLDVYDFGLKTDLFENLQSHAEQKRLELQNENPSDVLFKTLRGVRVIPGNGLKEVVLVPGYHFSPVNLRFDLVDRIVYQYPVFVEEEPAKSKLIRRLHTFADTNRIAILRALSDKDKRFTDISKLTELPKSTLHNHLLTLRDAELITIKSTLAKPDRYTLNRPALQELTNEFSEFVKAEFLP